MLNRSSFVFDLKLSLALLFVRMQQKKVIKNIYNCLLDTRNKAHIYVPLSFKFECQRNGSVLTEITKEQIKHK